MTTNRETTTKPAPQSVAAILKMMELAQQRNTQPPMIYPSYRNGAAKPMVYTVEAVLQMMAMAQQRNV